MPRDTEEAPDSPTAALPTRSHYSLALLHSLPGRLLVLSVVVLLILTVARQLVILPAFLELLRRVVSLTAIGAGGVLVVLGATRYRRALLWRVRRKLILSYIFIGVVPLVLVLAFALTGSMLLYITVTSYVFGDGLRDLTAEVQQIAESAAIEIGRTPGASQAVIDAAHGAIVTRYPQVSLAVVGRANGTPLSAGRWQHAAPPAIVPAWVIKRHDFVGRLVTPMPVSPSQPRIVVRAVSPAPDMRTFVVVDLPIDDDVLAKLEERTGTTIGGISAPDCGAPAPPDGAAATGSAWSLFRETVAILDCTRWADGATGTLSINVVAPIGRLADRMASIEATNIQAAVGLSWWSIFVNLLIALGVLFLLIQGSAAFMGGMLARSITSAVHELFLGTERVQHGDFAHRIRIESRDQLGDLADSFNRMSSSIEFLLHVQREKQRLDDELRIARDIQKSLLPVRPPQMAGVEVADFCEPAREVGGDYYDFFQLGPRQLAVLMADVSGKGTSAALYMAELKGLVLALSETVRSPRRLLIELNRLLAEHLDNRSFITMTYLVLDLEARTLTAARAGHTPLIVVTGGEPTVIAPDGMVLGLRLPGAEARFAQVLDEHTRPIRPGDLIVLFTDGVTEAMDQDGEMFGDEALARVVRAHAALDAAAIRERVVRDVKAFVGEAEPHDDMTLVVLRIEPDGEAHG